MNAEVCAVEIMRDSDRAHATFTPFSLDFSRDIPFRTKQQLTRFFVKAGARATVLHADIFILQAVFDEHHFTRPMMK